MSQATESLINWFQQTPVGMSPSPQLKEAFLRVDSDSESLLIVLPPSTILHAYKGAYGGYVIRLNDLNEIGIDVNKEKLKEELEELIGKANTYIVSPKINAYYTPTLDDINKLPEHIKQIIDYVDENIPDDVKKKVNKDLVFLVEEIEYQLTEVNVVVKRVTEKYAVLDVEPKRGAKKLFAKAIRINYIYGPSTKSYWAYVSGAEQWLKERKAIHPDNEVVQRLYARAVIEEKRAAIAYKEVVEVPEDLIPKQEVKQTVEQPYQVSLVPEDELAVQPVVAPAATPTAIQAMQTAVVTPVAKPELVPVVIILRHLPHKDSVKYSVKMEANGEEVIERKR